MTRNGALAALALGLGGLAALVGEASPGMDRAVLAEAAAGGGRVDVISVARWIRAREPGLVVIDLRPAAVHGVEGEGAEPTAGDGPRLPGARPRSLADLDTVRIDPGSRVVLYAEGPVRAAQGWLVLRLRGQPSVFFLEHGVADWIDGVLAPVLPDSATALEVAAWSEVSELSRYFGGVPSRGGPRSADGRVVWLSGSAVTHRAATAPATRRVGCGF